MQRGRRFATARRKNPSRALRDVSVEVMALTETSELRRGAQRYLRTAMRAPLLDAEHERDLARAGATSTTSARCTN